MRQRPLFLSLYLNCLQDIAQNHSCWGISHILDLCLLRVWNGYLRSVKRKQFVESIKKVRARCNEYMLFEWVRERDEQNYAGLNSDKCTHFYLLSSWMCLWRGVNGNIICHHLIASHRITAHINSFYFFYSVNVDNIPFATNTHSQPPR